jgi:hypothetical protein
VRVNSEEFLVAVALAVDKSYEQAARPRAQNVFQDANLKVELKPVASDPLALLKKAGVTARRSRITLFLDVFVG